MSTATIVERVREAHATRRPLRVHGAGTWLGAGQPVSAGSAVSLAEDRGIVEYVPGDLTLTARAGTRLSEIADATRAHGQWLPLDPWGGDEGTLGATVSTATAGPHAYAMGLPRDVVLGLEFVSGSGQVIRSGGRVVKNVAGFDLTRLVIGSWGTLGVVTEVTVRLRARPERTRTLAVSVSSTAGALSELATRLRALPFVPLASEIVSRAFATHLGLGDEPILLLRIGGNEKSVRGQLDLLRVLGGGTPRDLDDTVWDRLRTAEVANAATWRWSQLPAVFGETWDAAETATRDLPGTFIHGNPMRAIVRVIARPSGDAAELARAASGFSGTVAIENLPAAAWSLVQAPLAQDPVSRAIRGKFDPAGILNAGILGEAA